MTFPPITTHTEVVLFDVGGVLIRLVGIDAWKEMTGQTDEAEIWRRWLLCSVVQEYERGHCTADQFVSGMIDKYNLDIGPEDFLAAFASWPDGLYDGASELVKDVVDHVRVGCFSNTNDVHWETQICNQEVHELFDVHFLSYKMGHVKPHVSAFQYVMDELGCEPGAIFFIDDNIINVEAARSCGWNAHVTKGPIEAKTVLKEHGLLKT